MTSYTGGQHGAIDFHRVVFKPFVFGQNGRHLVKIGAKVCTGETPGVKVVKYI